MALEQQPRQQDNSSLGLLAMNQLLLCRQLCPLATSSCPCDPQPQHLHNFPTYGCLVLLHCCSPHPSGCLCLQAGTGTHLDEHLRSCPLTSLPLAAGTTPSVAAAGIVLQAVHPAARSCCSVLPASQMCTASSLRHAGWETTCAPPLSPQLLHCAPSQQSVQGWRPCTAG